MHSCMIIGYTAVHCGHFNYAIIAQMNFLFEHRPFNVLCKNQETLWLILGSGSPGLVLVMLIPRCPSSNKISL